MNRSNAQRIAEGVAWAGFIIGMCVLTWAMGRLIEWLFMTLGGWLA